MTNRLTIDKLLKTGESQTVEFKASFGRETIESLVAFANVQGGTVLVGVADDSSILGVTIGKETLNGWLGQIKSATSPAIIPDIEAVQVDYKWVVAIHINEYPVKPVNTKGKYFKRVANSNHQLSLSEITNLYLQSLQASWDAHEAQGESLDSLSVNKIEKFISVVNGSGRFTLDQSPILALQKLKYVVNDKPTWASTLLFATEPPRHHIHIGRFKTPTMIIDDRQISDTLTVYPELSFTVEETSGGILVSFCRSEGVNEGVNELYCHIRKTPGIRIPELSQQLHVPTKTLERWIKQLRDERKVNFKGAPKTGGYYVVD